MTSEISLEIKYSDLYQTATHMNYKCTGNRHSHSQITENWWSSSPSIKKVLRGQRAHHQPSAEDVGKVDRDLELTGCWVLMCLETLWSIRKDKSTMNEPYLTKSWFPAQVCTFSGTWIKAPAIHYLSLWLWILFFSFRRNQRKRTAPTWRRFQQWLL